MTRTEAVEYLELAKTIFIDEDSSIYHNEIWNALVMAIDALTDDEVDELRGRVDELEELLQDPSRIGSSSFYTLGRL